MATRKKKPKPSLIYLYNILGFVHLAATAVVVVLLSIHPSRSSKFLIPEEEDDGTRGGG